MSKKPSQTNSFYQRKTKDFYPVSKLEDMTSAILTIMADLPKEPMSGELPCPRCKTGTVKWIRVGHKKHLRMGCTTPDCILMMQ